MRFDFFYTTNRLPGNAQGDIDQHFESERNTTLKFGSFDTRIAARLGLGMIIDPSEWFLNEEIQLQNVQALEQERFLAQLREQVEASPQRSLLIVVHGFKEAFQSALRKTAFLAHVLDINTPTLVFDWPGDQGSSLRGYRRARRVAQASGAELADMLKLIINDVQPERLWLMANSMGAQVAVDAFHLLYKDTDFSDVQTEFENVMLTAADVDHAEFNTQFKQEIKALADNITVYVSSNAFFARVIKTSISSAVMTRGGEMIIRSPTCRIIRLLAKQRSRHMKPTVPASLANLARLSLCGLRGREAIIPEMFNPPTNGCSAASFSNPAFNAGPATLFT